MYEAIYTFLAYWGNPGKSYYAKILFNLICKDFLDMQVEIYTMYVSDKKVFETIPCIIDHHKCPFLSTIKHYYNNQHSYRPMSL